MKKTVMLLNNLERKYFEEIYQCLNDDQQWKMKNVFNQGTAEYNECRVFPLKFYTRDKPTRLSVAAHEAGHALVLTATHGHIGRAIIDVKDHPKGWIGWVDHQVSKGNKDYWSIKQEGMPIMPLIRIDTLIESGGFVGESFIGKMTGGNHEKFMVYCRCRFLDDRDGVEPLTNWNYYINWCRKIILNNENLFWRIIDDLLENSELTESVKILLHNGIKKEAPNLFFN